MKKFSLLCFFFIIAESQVFSGETVSSPYAFMRISVPANSQKLISIPFSPISNGINSVFSGQMTGAANQNDADKTVHWNPLTQGYVTNYKSETGQWLDSNGNPSSATIETGIPFFIQNCHATEQALYLCGALILDSVKTVTIQPNMNLIAYPFPAKIALNSTTLSTVATGAENQSGSSDVISTVNPASSYWLMNKEGDINNGKWMDTANVATNLELKSGSGVWFNRRTSSSLTWSENRPYLDVFGTPGTSAPQITNIFPESSLNAITLSISCSGTEGEKLDIFYKDVGENESLVTDTAWSIAAMNLPTNGNTSISWTDSGDSATGRTAVTGTFIRIYLVARADIDYDQDGLPDGREIYVYKTNYTRSDSDLDGMPDGWEVQYGLNPCLNDSSGDLDNDDLTNLREYQLGSDPTHGPLKVPKNLLVFQEAFTKSVICWDAVTTGTVDGYKVYRNGNFIGTTTGLNFTDTALSKGTSYTYTVKAYNVSEESDPSEPVGIRTLNSLGTPDDQTIENAVNLANALEINSSNLLSNMQGIFNSLGFTDTTFTVLDPNIVNTFINDEMNFINESSTPMTYEESETTRTEIDDFMTQYFKGHSFEKVYTFHKLIELGDRHWQAGNIAAAEKLYEEALTIISDVEGMTFTTLWQLARFKMMYVNDSSTDQEIVTALNASRDIMLRYFNYFPGTTDYNAINVYTAIVHRYFNYFPRLLAYSNYNNDIYSEALAHANSAKNLANTTIANTRISRLSAWELILATVTFKTPADTTMSGTLELTNTSPERLYPIGKITDERTIAINGTTTVPIYNGHTYSATVYFDVEGGNPVKYTPGNMLHEKGKKYIYNYFTLESIEDLTDPSAPCEIVFINSRPQTPYNLKATMAADTFTLSWDWVSPNESYQLGGFKVYRGGNLIGTTASQSLANIPIASPDMTYTYTVKAYDVNGVLTDDSWPLTVLPTMTAEQLAYYNWKTSYFGTLSYYDYEDVDGDGLTNLQEYQNGTNPLTNDTDADGLSDSYEIQIGMSPTIRSVNGYGYKYEVKLDKRFEEGDTTGWAVYDNVPAGAAISNIVDPTDPDNRCINLSGSALLNAYRYTFPDKEKSFFKVEWRMKYSEAFRVYVVCTTTAGTRYAYYSEATTNSLGTGSYIHHGLGAGVKDGLWHTVRRDIQRDIWDAQPTCNIISIDSIIVYGSGLIDDIRTLNYVDTDRDQIPDNIEVFAGLNPENHLDALQDLEGDGKNNVSEFFAETLLADADGDGMPDPWEASYGLNSSDASDAGADSDGDGLSNLQEFRTNNSPVASDSNNNGYSDWIEDLYYSERPSLSTRLISAKAQTIISLTWLPELPLPANHSGYRIYRDGQLVGKTTAPSFVDYNLAKGTVYHYTIKAIDNSGTETAVFSDVELKTKGSGEASYYVNASTGDDTYQGTTEAKPKRSIKSAIEAAPNGSVIYVAEGYYSEPLEIADKKLVLVGTAGASNTFIDTQCTGRGIMVKNVKGLSLIIEGFTIMAGKSATSGGGILIDSGSLILGNCTIKNNESGNNGGGVAIVRKSIPDSSPRPVFINCRFESNTAAGNGGGIYYSSGIIPGIKACDFISNSANGKGGGIYGKE